MVIEVLKKIIINYDLCNPKNCNYECLAVCPVTKRDPNNPSIFKRNGKPVIDNELCTHCNRCVISCPLNAISVVGKTGISTNVKSKSNKPVDLKMWKKLPMLVDQEMYHRFSQQNTIFGRVGNDPDYLGYKKGIYSEHEKIYEENKPGYSQIEAAMSGAAWTVHDKFAGAFSWGNIETVEGVKFDDPVKINSVYQVDDPIEMSKIIKQVAKGFGAVLVGIAKYNENWIYTHDRVGKKIVIPDQIKNIIVIAIEMDLEALQTSPAFTAAFATGNGYSRMAFVQSCLAEFIRNLGYSAIPAGNGTGLSVPMAIEAGLGQYGRHGLLITEKYGSNVRLCKVLTDMPLDPDKPIDLGALEFCRSCMKCADNCPSNSISTDKDPTWSGTSKSNNPGIYKWYVNVETCYEFWTRNGNDCSNCIVSCPFTKNKHWSHKFARFLIKRMPYLNPLWIKLDNLLGYGKQRNPEEFWDEKRNFIHTRTNRKT